MGEGRISKKQQEILDYLKQEIIDKGFPPSVREICEAVGLRSTSSVHAHLEALEKNGYIKKDATHPRAIEIIDGSYRSDRIRKLGLAEDVQTDQEYANVPVLGHVAAGQPLLAVEQIESYFPIPVEKLPNQQTFMLRVHGDSMVNAGILDGDLVLVKQQPAASDGDMVVALLDDSATVKRFYREKDHVRLQPENDFMAPILVPAGQDVQILGVVIGAMRFFR